MLVLDYAERGSLRDLLDAANRQNGWLTLATALNLAQQITVGLLTLHTPVPDLMRHDPIIHRDLKPENILRDKEGYAMITDFGLAKAVIAPIAPKRHDTSSPPSNVGSTSGQQAMRDVQIERTSAPDIENTLVVSGRSQVFRTNAGFAVGTPAYMAPEQWMDARTVDLPVDLYAFGIILAELIAGHHPLLPLDQPQTPAAWRQVQTDGYPIPLRQLGAESFAIQLAAIGTPSERAAAAAAIERLEGLIAQLLAKQPSLRPSAEETLVVLQEVAAELGKEPYRAPNVYPHGPEIELIFWRNWAKAFAQFKLYEEALPRIERAVALAPRSTRVLTDYGTILAGLGRNQEALEQYRQALALTSEGTHDSRIATLNQLGIMFSEMARYAEAEQVYVEVIRLVPSQPDTWFNWANNAQQWALAEQAAEQIVAAQAQVAAGLAHIATALLLNPDHSDYLQLQQGLRQLREELRGQG